MLLSYLFRIKSERQLIKEIEVNLAYRWFLGMSLTEKVIDASTLIQNRIRRFNGTYVFEHIFTYIVWQAMEKSSANKNKKHHEKREVRVS